VPLKLYSRVNVYRPTYAPLYLLSYILVIFFFNFVDLLAHIMSLFFFTNLMHELFILIHSFQSSTCLEHYCAHLQEDKLYWYSIWFRHCFWVTVQYTVYERTLNLCPEHIYYISVHVSSTIVLFFSTTVVLV
jgi:hypothetical protein